MTTRTRQRRTKTTGKALVLRTAETSDLAHDLRILSSRLAVTPEPVFWAPGELDARLALAVPVEADYDDNYRAVFGDDPWWYWNWYQDALREDELAKVPVLTVVRDVPDDDPELTARVQALMGEAVRQFPGEGWAAAPVDVPGPDEDAVPPASSTEDPPTGAPGPGTSNDDPALD